MSVAIQENASRPEFGRWTQSITRANTEFKLHCFGNAILLYNQSLDQALYEFDSIAQTNCDRAVSQVLISLFNLADCYIAIEQIDRASGFYLDALSFLLKNSRDSLRGNEAGQAAINHALSHTNVLWLDFLKKHRSRLAYRQMMEYQRLASELTAVESELAVRH